MAFFVAGPMAATRRPGAKALDFLRAERGAEAPLFHGTPGNGSPGSPDVAANFSIRDHIASTPFALVRISQS
jgi:hypothetical protein